MRAHSKVTASAADAVSYTRENTLEEFLCVPKIILG